MKAVVYESLGTLGLSDIPVPKPGSGEALVRTRASGVCHTDIDILHGRYGNSDFPLVPGHEYAGVIDALGEGVEGFSIGDRVVVDPNYNCGECPACKKGLTNLCEILGAYGVSSNGGFAEASIVAIENLVPIGDMPFELAALAEPMGCALNGIDAVETENAKNALIFGAGPIGHLIALGLKSKGVADITLVDIDSSRLELAESFGFTGVAAGSDEINACHQAMDIVVDATGVPAVAQKLTDYAANGGSVLFFGVCPQDAKIEISPFEVFRRQLRIAGAHSLNHNIPAALEAIRFNGSEIGRLVSHKVALSDIPSFLNGQSKEKTLKVQMVSE